VHPQANTLRSRSVKSANWRCKGILLAPFGFLWFFTSHCSAHLLLVRALTVLHTLTTQLPWPGQGADCSGGPSASGGGSGYGELAEITPPHDWMSFAQHFRGVVNAALHEPTQPLATEVCVVLLCA
jgi:hypothetical protein